MSYSILLYFRLPYFHVIEWKNFKALEWKMNENRWSFMNKDNAKPEIYNKK